MSQGNPQKTQQQEEWERQDYESHEQFLHSSPHGLPRAILPNLGAGYCESRLVNTQFILDAVFS